MTVAVGTITTNTRAQKLEVRSQAMNFCATPGIDEWLGAVLNDPRGAGFAKRLLLQQGFLDRKGFLQRVVETNYMRTIPQMLYVWNI